MTSHLSAVAFLPDITRHLDRAGWDVTVVCSPGAGLNRLTDSSGTRVVTVPMKRDPDVVADIVSLARLARAVHRIRPDVVVTATPKASLLGTLAARLMRSPHIVHLMWGLRSETLTGPMRTFVRLLETIGTRMSDRVIAESRSLAAVLVREHMVRAERLSVLGSGSAHGIDLVRFAPGATGGHPRATQIIEQLEAVGSGPVIGCVGRLHRDKGVDMLLDAVGRLNASGRACRLLLVGSRDDALVVSRVEQAKERGLPLVLVDPESGVLPPYDLMDLHCLPTQREGLPIVCLEASACEIPNVTTDATGAIDSVLDGVTGLIVRKNDVESLTRALGALLEDAELRAKLGRSGRQWVVAEFEAEGMCRRYTTYLDALVEVEGAPPRKESAA